LLLLLEEMRMKSRRFLASQTLEQLQAILRANTICGRISCLGTPASSPFCSRWASQGEFVLLLQAHDERNSSPFEPPASSSADAKLDAALKATNREFHCGVSRR